MISAEGEKVPFTKTLYPEGNVEDWLLEVENVMRESLRQILSNALEDYITVSLTNSNTIIMLLAIFFKISCNYYSATCMTLSSRAPFVCRR
jgi:hypothetical protein